MSITVNRFKWRTLAKASVLLAFFGMSAWWLALLIGPESLGFSGIYQYVPFWIPLVPMLVTVALAWPLGWRWRGAALAALLVFLWPVMGFNFGRPDEGAGRFRLMTYNIKAYLVASEVGGFDGVIAEIDRQDPDILVLQDAAALRADEEPDMPAVRKIVGNRRMYAFGQYVIASRYPLRDCKAGNISYNAEEHTFVQCVVNILGQDVDLVTAHFLSPRDGLNAIRWSGPGGYGEWRANVEDRLLQSRQLAELVAKRVRPLILAGDLNAPESSLVIRNLLDAGLRDAFTSAGWGYGYTHGHSLKPHLFSTIRIDHILVSRDLGIADCFVGGKDGSEHRPVVADLWMY